MAPVAPHYLPQAYAPVARAAKHALHAATALTLQTHPQGRTTTADHEESSATTTGRSAATLEQIVNRLRERHFPHTARASRCPAEARQDATHLAEEQRTFDSLCTALALRTGVDLRSPRPEQHFDRLLIDRVVQALGHLGYEIVTPADSPSASGDPVSH